MESNKAGKPIITAWQFLQSFEGKHQSTMENLPLSFIDKNWVSWVVKKDGSIDRKAYTFWILEQLVKGLQRRDLFVNKSERWSNPAAKYITRSSLGISARLFLCASHPVCMTAWWLAKESTILAIELRRA